MYQMLQEVSSELSIFVYRPRKLFKLVCLAECTSARAPPVTSIARGVSSVSNKKEGVSPAVAASIACRLGLWVGVSLHEGHARFRAAVGAAPTVDGRGEASIRRISSQSRATGSGSLPAVPAPMTRAAERAAEVTAAHARARQSTS